MRDGKPIPNAVFTAIDSDLSEETIKAGPDGTAVWTPPAPGRYSIYVRETIKQTGTLDGKTYDEIREFATLALNWPLEPREADPEAVALFKEAIAHRAQWRDFPGFSAEIERPARRPAVRRQGHRQGRWLGRREDRRPGRQALAPGSARLDGHASPGPAGRRLVRTHGPRLRFADGPTIIRSAG